MAAIQIKCGDSLDLTLEASFFLFVLLYYFYSTKYLLDNWYVLSTVLRSLCSLILLHSSQ